MTETKITFCRICEACCGLKVDVDAGRITDVRPDPHHVVSRGYACAKGIRAREAHESPDRLKHPMKRVGSQWKTISWEQALREIGEKVRHIRREHGADAIGAYIGNPVAFSTTHPIFLNAFLQGIGTRNVYSAGSQDCNNKFFVAQQMYGSPMIQPIPDLDRTGCFVCIGSNPAVSHSSIVQLPRPVERLRAIERRGGEVWHVNPRRTETARLVGRQVFIRPDTDVFFLLAFLQELIRTGGVEHERVRRHMRGYDELARIAAPWTPERVAEVTGIDPSTLRAMVASYRQASEQGQQAVLYASTGLNQGRHGTLAFWLLNCINAVSGNLDRRGGALVARGLFDVPAMMDKMGAGKRRDRSRIGGFRAVLDTFPAGVLPDEIETPGSGQVRAMFVSAGNPVLSCPDEARMRRALGQLDLLVCVDLFRSETAELADYVLPATSFFERADLPLAVNGFFPEPYVQYTDAVVPPDGEQREEWRIFADLCTASGIAPFGSRMAGALVRLGTWASGKDGLARKAGLTTERILGGLLAASGRTTLGQLRRHPHGMRLRDHAGDDFLGKRVRTADGRVDLAPEEIAPLAPHVLEQSFEQERSGATAGLRLIPKREAHTHNSWMHNVPGLVRGRRGRAHLFMHPEDAWARGLEQGSQARVRSATGSVEVPLRLTDEVMPGTVALPHGWGHAGTPGLSVASQLEGPNSNRLAAADPSALERFTGMTQLTGIPVEVEGSGPSTGHT